MKHLLITTIAAVLLVGCVESHQSATPEETQPAERVAEVARDRRRRLARRRHDGAPRNLAGLPEIQVVKAADHDGIEVVSRRMHVAHDVGEHQRHVGLVLEVAHRSLPSARRWCPRRTGEAAA